MGQSCKGAHAPSPLSPTYRRRRADAGVDQTLQEVRVGEQLRHRELDNAQRRQVLQHDLADGVNGNRCGVRRPGLRGSLDNVRLVAATLRAVSECGMSAHSYDPIILARLNSIHRQLERDG